MKLSRIVLLLLVLVFNQGCKQKQEDFSHIEYLNKDDQLIEYTLPSEDEIQELEILAKRGDADAEYRLAQYCSSAIGGADHRRAFTLCESAAKKGHPLAMMKLSVMYYNGEGVSANTKKSLKWMAKAADTNNINVLRALGNRYEKGLYGYEKDYQEAKKWYRLAAEQGSTTAKKALAFLLYDDAQSERDYAESYRLLSSLVEEGDKGGKILYYLGLCYYEGRGVNRNASKAVDYLQQASFEQFAQIGIMEAQYLLGLCYYQGDGIPKNYNRALYWMLISVRNASSLEEALDDDQLGEKQEEKARPYINEIMQLLGDYEVELIYDQAAEAWSGRM